MPVLDGSARPADLARVLGALSVAGSAIGLVALLLPLPAATDRTAMTVLALSVGGVGVTLLVGARRIAPWVPQVALAMATIAVSTDVALSSGSAVNDEMLYALPACCALLFCRGRLLAFQLALIPVGYGAGLAIAGDPLGVARWAMTIGVLVAVAIVVRALAHRVRRGATTLADTEARFRTAFEEAPTGMTLGRFDGTWMRVNRSFAAFLGHEGPAELRRLSLRDVTHPDELEEVVGALARMAAGEIDVYRAERRYLRRDGTVVSGQLAATVIRDAEGAPRHYIAHIQDISERKAAEAELAYRAGHDPLTGLPNRALLVDRLAGALARLTRRDGEVSVLFLDLDRFKLVNDSFGHQAGDRVVQAAAQRLRALLRPEDTLARLGGDEFTVLCESPHPGTAELVAGRIVEALSAPFDVAGRAVFLSASIGITRTRDHLADPGLLLAEADAAMYEAKEHGGSRHAAYTAGLRLRGAERLELEAGLRRGLEAGELEVHYQPEVDLYTGEIAGLEALVRWRHPVRGLLAPGHFIAMAEESGLIIALGAEVARQACADARRWHDAGHPVRVGVNLSARQLADPALPDTMRGALSDAGLPAWALLLEITETALMEDEELGVRVLAELAELGVTLAIDDFGVGFSSLSRFRSLEPVEVVKIDRSFIAGLGRSEQDGAIVGGIVGIARSLGLTTVAEGIERPGQAEDARILGCDLGQGFHFARPAPAAAVDALLAAATHGELAV